MENDPSFPTLLPFMNAYPLQAGSIYNTYSDLSLSHQWMSLRLFEIRECKCAVLFGQKSKLDPIRLILPISITSNLLTPSYLSRLFLSLSALSATTLPPPIPSSLSAPPRPLNTPSNPSEDAEQPVERALLPGVEEGKFKPGELDLDTIYISIVTGDSSVVYYKLSRGVKKPADVPDE